MSLLEQDITKTGWMNKFLPMPEFEIGNNKKYEIEVIQDNVVYAKKID